MELSSRAGSGTEASAECIITYRPNKPSKRACKNTLPKQAGTRRNISRPKSLGASLMTITGGAFGFDEQAEGGASGDRFKAQCSGAGEGVDHTGAFEIRGPAGMGEDVEDALAGAIGCRPCFAAIRRLDGASDRDNALGLSEINGLLRFAERRLGLLTNGDAAVQKKKVEVLGLGSLIDHVVYASEHAPGGKPAREPFVEVLRRLQVAPQDAVMVGDDPVNDVDGARAVGIRTIFLARTGRQHHDGADAVVHALSDVPGAAAALLARGMAHAA